MSLTKICYVITDGDGNLVDFFDTLDEALDCVYENDPDGTKDYKIKQSHLLKSEEKEKVN